MCTEKNEVTSCGSHILLLIILNVLSLNPKIGFNTNLLFSECVRNKIIIPSLIQLGFLPV